MNSISFDNVYLLFIALPLVALLAVPYALAVRKDNRNGHNIASMALHVLMALLVAFAAAGTKIVTVITETDVYVVADVSYSADRNLETIDGYIYDLSNNLPLNTRLGVVCFGNDCQLLTKLGEKPKSVKEATVDDSRTNITGALEYAASLFRDGVIKRIVLITDGKETDTGESNAFKRTVDGLVADGIHVDAIYLDDNLPDSAKEVQLSGAEYTSTAYLNHNETVEAVIQSSYLTGAIVSLYSTDGDERTLIEEKAVTLTSGSNTVSFRLDTSATGMFGYELTVYAEDDESPYNNSCRFSQSVTGSVKVLLITESEDDFAAAQTLLGDKAEIDAYVNDPVVPCSIEALCAYDEIFISNADISKLNNSTLFVQSLDTVVSIFGKGLVTLGDTSIQSKESDVLDQLALMLPLYYGNSGRDSKLYTFVIDSSRSMSTNSKLITAKRAVNNLIDTLEDDDAVCLVTFYGDVYTLWAPKQVGSDRAELKQTVEELDVTQGTFIGLGLRRALDLIEKQTSYGDKQVMLISDGLSYTGESDDPVEVVEEMRDFGITCSVIDVGRGADTGDASTRALQLLQNIASVGGGSYYYATEETVDEVIFGEVISNDQETTVTRDSWVTIKKRYDEAVNGIEDASYISGYINSTAKASATTVLTTEYQTVNGRNITVPVYTYWNYGSGTVASFTSSMGGDWLEAWREEGLDKTFFGNVLSSVTPDEKIDYPYTVDISRGSGYALIEVTPATIRSEATASVSVTLPDGEVLTDNLIFDSSSYVYGFAAIETGRYSVTVTYTYGDAEYTAETGFDISYLPEYDSFAVFDASVLRKAVGTDGTVSEDGKLTITTDEHETGLRTVTLTVPLLITCVALFAVDIMIRKLKWNDIKSLFVKVNK